MKKIIKLLATFFLALLLFYATPASADPTKFAPIIMGWMPGELNAGSSTFTTSTANTRVAFSFVPTQNKTISKATVWIDNVTGTVTGGQFSLDLYGDTATIPGSLIEAKTSGTAPTTGTQLQVTGYTSALTAGTRYWLVNKNTNGTPASNNWRFRFSDTTSNGYPKESWGPGSQDGSWGWAVKISTDATTYPTTQRVDAALLVEYSDGSVQGILTSNQSNAINSGLKIFGSTEAGVKFTTPSSNWPTVNVAGIVWNVAVSGTVPSGGLRARLYQGASATPIATSSTVPAANITDDKYVYFPFDTSTTLPTLPANTIIRITLGAVSGGDSSNYVGAYNMVLWNNSANKAQTFMGGTAATQLSGGTFTETDTIMLPFGLALDTTQPFTTSGGSASVVGAYPAMNGGMQ